MNKLNPETFSRILRQVTKPSSYLGTEVNSIHKDYQQVKGSIALAFPDLYEIGMSHLGLKILYNIINAEEDLAAERVFAPGDDFAVALHEENLPFMSLETKRPLAEFDAIGFTIPYELCYTTILWMLDLAGIPLRAARRDEHSPFIIGGGAGVYNPEPIAPFFDLFLLGDGEESAPAILREIIASRGQPRREALEQLAKIPGVYVPSFHDVEYGADGKIKSVEPNIKGLANPLRVHLPSLSQSPYPVKMVVPFGKPVQNRLTVEIDRGCSQACRFCQAGMTYRPVRERTPAEVMEIFDKALENSGHGEISLMSLSAGDYSNIGELLTSLMDRYRDEKVFVSLPSLRPATVTEVMIDQLKRGPRGGFTIAAEAGSARLRAVLNKKVTDEQIMTTAQRLLDAGWKSLKLYFMLGLPTETWEDIEAIVHLAGRISALKSEYGRFKNISVSVSNFVPKAHTPFQWTGQDTLENLTAKKERLFELIKPNKRLRLKWSSAGMSRMEAVFSRGDRRLASAVETAYKAGARLDAWTEKFSYDRWIDALEGNGIDPAFYANRDFDESETLPWEHLNTGLSKRYFLKEMALARQAVVTQDCRTEKCLACGLDPKTCFKFPKAPIVKTVDKPKRTAQGRFRYRLTYHKKDMARFFATLETNSIIMRAFRISAIPVAYSEGFSPRPRVSFGPALALAMESADEQMDVELYSYMEPWAINVRLNSTLPEGFHFVDARQIRPGAKSISASITAFDYRIRLENPPGADKMEQAIKRFLAMDKTIVPRGTAGKQMDIRPMITNLEFEKESLDLVYTATFGPSGSARPGDILAGMFPGAEVAINRAVKLKAHLRTEGQTAD